jgi:hypothetical protein
MIIALTHIQPPARASHCGRNGFVRALVLGCAVACASVPAFAGQDRDRDGQRNPPQQQGPQVREPQRMAAPPPQLQSQPQQRAEMPRQYDHRVYDTRMVDPRMEEQRRQVQQQEGARRAPRLTPDERRELRRQINEAGTDLYPNTPRR